jgi:hypothetical protein
VTEPSLQARQDIVEWSTLWPLDKPEPKVQRGTRWRYFRSLYNAPTLTGLILGVWLQPWMQGLRA